MYSERLLLEATAELYGMELETLLNNAQILLELKFAQVAGKLDWLPNAISTPPLARGEMLGQWLDCIAYHSAPYVFRVWYVSPEEKPDPEAEPQDFWWSLSRHGEVLDDSGEHFASSVEECITAARNLYEANTE